MQFLRCRADNLFPVVPGDEAKGVVDLDKPAGHRIGQGEGRGVGIEQPVEALQSFLFLAEILAQPKQTGFLIPLAMPDPGFHGQQSAIPGCQRQRAGIGRSLGHGLEDACRFPEQMRRMQIDEVHAQQLGPTETQYRGGGAVAVQDHALTIADKDQVSHAVKKGAEILFALP